MTDKPRYPYADAMGVANALCDMLATVCERIQIAGSLRRKKSMVGDIELLFVPKIGERQVDLLGTEKYDMADAMINDLEMNDVLDKRPNVRGHFTWGQKNKLAIHVKSQIPVDFFSTDLDCWANALVVRTGGKDSNLLITTTAQRLGYTFHAYGSGFTHLRTGEFHRTKSEADVFEFLGLPFLAPEQRK